MKIIVVSTRLQNNPFGYIMSIEWIRTFSISPPPCFCFTSYTFCYKNKNNICGHLAKTDCLGAGVSLNWKRSNEKIQKSSKACRYDKEDNRVNLTHLLSVLWIWDVILRTSFSLRIWTLFLGVINIWKVFPSWSSRRKELEFNLQVCSAQFQCQFNDLKIQKDMKKT